MRPLQPLSIAPSSCRRSADIVCPAPSFEVVRFAHASLGLLCFGRAQLTDHTDHFRARSCRVLLGRGGFALTYIPISAVLLHANDIRMFCVYYTA
jgi:hypothetical protein